MANQSAGQYSTKRFDEHDDRSDIARSDTNSEGFQHINPFTKLYLKAVIEFRGRDLDSYLRGIMYPLGISQVKERSEKGSFSITVWQG